MRTSLLVPLFLGAVALPAQESDFGTCVPTTLSEVRAEPEAFRGVRLQFTIQFGSLGRISNPFFTKFTPTDFVNFYAWADEQQIWQQATYKDLFGMLFYSKLGEKLEQLYEVRLYERLLVTGIVRNTFQNQPWIEVLDFERVPGQVDAAVLSHLYRGEKMMAERKWQRAIGELSMVSGEGVPQHALRAMHKNLGVCYLRIGEAKQAEAHLVAASALVPETDFELERLLASVSADPGAELDRTIPTTGVRDSERPMWEAFDGDRPTQGKALN
jgi:hypothetical protein